ncbi:MAG: DinB family protein [Acidobacteria bacterium]|nr:DinB family protein [Acidobacteriota bacterium]
MQTQLREVVEQTVPHLRVITEEAAAAKPAPDKWSYKEELGHLIDSAANNHQRFIRLQLQPELTLPGYAQEGWVLANQYQQASWADLITLWSAYNLHLAFVIGHIDPTLADRIWHHPEADYTLQFLVDDYVVHMKGHLATIGVA